MRDPICFLNGQPVPCPDWANEGFPFVFGAFFAIFAVFWLAMIALYVASLWRIFEKAGEKGWKALVPFYNVVVLLRVSGRPGWWLILFFVPIVNLFAAVLSSLSLAKTFGKGEGFAVGLVFLNVVFLPLLAFGEATYQKPARA